MSNSCLREGAAEWYASELTELQRSALLAYTVDHEFGWFNTLLQRWKGEASAASQQFSDGYSSWKDVQNKITDPLLRLRMIWMRIDPYLQRDIPEPGPGTTVATFIMQLEKRYPQWLNMDARVRELRRQKDARRSTNAPARDREDRRDRDEKRERNDRRERVDKYDRRDKDDRRHERDKDKPDNRQPWNLHVFPLQNYRALNK